MKRAEAAGCPVLAWTIDFLGGLNPETALRFMRLDTRDCLSCHTTAPTLGGVNPQVNRSKPMFSGLHHIVPEYKRRPALDQAPVAQN